MKLTGARCLVTGGGGYLAVPLVKRLKDAGAFVEAPDKNTLDVRDCRQLEDVLRDVSVVFHLAARTTAEHCDFDTNVMSMHHIVDICRKQKKKRVVILASTATISGPHPRLPADATQDDPWTPYDFHKLQAESVLARAVGEGVVSGCSLRLANVYGPGGPLNEGRGVLDKAIRAAVERGEILLYDEAKFAVRDYVYVADVVRAFTAAAKHSELLEGRSFVISSGVGIPLKSAFESVADAVRGLTGRSVNISYCHPAVPLMPIELRNFIGDSSLFMARTGWRTAVAFDDGVMKTVAETLTTL
jgi:nucleoside-diphosphate-sugar epimerase